MQLWLFFFVVSISDLLAYKSAERRRIKKFAKAIAVLALASIFVALGWWQLDRARELKSAQSKPAVVDSAIYPLEKVTSPFGDLPAEAYGKIVSASGHYIANFKAPNQIDADGKVSDWEVALLQTDTKSAILVVRGLWKDRFVSPDIVMSTNVTVTGQIFPHQIEDRAENTSLQLSRLDSSLLTSVTDYQLYDGFITEKSESYRNGTVDRSRVLVELSQGAIPGYYWQHISYVCIWWLMAALVLWAPFYKRKED